MATNPLIHTLPERLRTPALSRDERRSRQAEPHICPRCDRKFGLRSPRYRRHDERPVAWAKGVPGNLMPAWALHQIGAATAECPRCGKSWPLLASDEPDNLDNAGFSEQTRTLETVGEDTYLVDNSRGRQPLTRKIAFTLEWQRSVKVDAERTRESGPAGKLSVPGIELTRTFEQSVKAHYEAANATTHTQSEEVTVTADPGTVTSVTVTRRHKWEHGTMRVPDGRGRTLEVPYSVIVGMTFDVAQEDVLTAGLPAPEETP